MKNYDLIVIGAGSAGLGSSGVAKALGLSVLIVEAEAKNVGGDCLNYGCVPSKALIHVAKQYHYAKESQRFGNEVSGAADWDKVIGYVHDKQAVIRAHESAEYLVKQGFDVELGWAKFVDKKTIEVNGKKFSARIIVLGTGSRPRRIPIPGMEHVQLVTNEELFFELKSLPKNFVVIGGGPIGCEMAQAFARLGSKVTIVNRGVRILKNEKKEYSEILTKQFEKEGIAVHNNATVSEFTAEKKAVVQLKDGSSFSIDSDVVLLSIGRVVNSSNMDLEKAGIELTDRKKYKIDHYLRTTNKRVYAIGDAAGKYMFSHGAEKQVRLMWQNLVNPLKKKDQTKHLSWVTFTDPEISTWGRSEKELQDAGISYWRQDQDYHEDDRAIVDEYEFGHVSLLMTRGSSLGNRRILGGSMIATNAGEMSQEFMLAMEAEVPIQKIFDRVYPYPVGSRVNQKAIRGVVEKRLTPFLNGILRRLFWLFN